MIKYGKCCGILLETAQLNAIGPPPLLTKSTPKATPPPPPTPAPSPPSPPSAPPTPPTPPTSTQAAVAVATASITMTPPATATAGAAPAPAPAAAAAAPATAATVAAAAAPTTTAATRATTIVNSCRCRHCQHAICANPNATSGYAHQTQSFSHNDLFNGTAAACHDGEGDGEGEGGAEYDIAMDGRRIGDATVPAAERQPESQRHQTLIKTNLKTISSDDNNTDDAEQTTAATVTAMKQTSDSGRSRSRSRGSSLVIGSGSSISTNTTSTTTSSSRNECDIFQETAEMRSGKVDDVLCSTNSRKSAATEARPARFARHRSASPRPGQGWMAQSLRVLCVLLLLPNRCCRQRRHKSSLAQHTFRIYLILQLAGALSLPFVACSDSRSGQPHGDRAESSTLLQGLSLALGVAAGTSSTAPTMTNSIGLPPDGGGAPLDVTLGGGSGDGGGSAAPVLVDSAGGRNIINLLSRDTVLKRHNNQSTAVAAGLAVGGATTAASAMPVVVGRLMGGAGGGGGAGVCQSCQMREKAKIDNLESIKMQILMRLQLSQLPNITAPIAVPHNIIENFYKKYNMTTHGQRVEGPPHHHHGSYQARGSERSRAGGGGGGRIPANRKPAAKAGGAGDGGGRNLYYLNPYPSERAEDETIAAYSEEGTAAYGEDAGGSGRAGGRRVKDGGDGDNDDDEDDDMQSDDPYFYHEHYGDSSTGSATASAAAAALSGLFADYNDDGDADFDDNGEDDEFFSRVNSVYVFPTTPHMRHNHKPEVLNFKFENNHSTIVRAFVHIYMRGLDWIRDYDASLLEQKCPNGTSVKRQDIVITVHRAVRRPNAVNFTHTIKLTESRHKIPPGLGQWVQIEVKQLATHWMENRDATQSLVMKGLEPWMRPFIVTNGGPQNKPLTVHIEVVTRDKRRRKRSTSLDCQESDQEVRCCRYPLKVNFTNFGWHFVVAPTSFDAYFCNGECKVGYLEQYTHTHIASLTTSATPCCSPTKMSSLSLLYFNLDQTLVLSTIPNMSVDKCSCS